MTPVLSNAKWVARLTGRTRDHDAEVFPQLLIFESMWFLASSQWRRQQISATLALQRCRVAIYNALQDLGRKNVCRSLTLTHETYFALRTRSDSSSPIDLLCCPLCLCYITPIYHVVPHMVPLNTNYECSGTSKIFFLKRDDNIRSINLERSWGSSRAMGSQDTPLRYASLRSIDNKIVYERNCFGMHVCTPEYKHESR